MGIRDKLEEMTTNQIRKFAQEHGIKTLGLPRSKLIEHIVSEWERRGLHETVVGEDTRKEQGGDVGMGSDSAYGDGLDSEDVKEESK